MAKTMKKVLALLLVFCMAMSLVTGVVAVDGYGSGTAEDPWTVGYSVETASATAPEGTIAEGTYWESSSGESRLTCGLHEHDASCYTEELTCTHDCAADNYACCSLTAHTHDEGCATVNCTHEHTDRCCSLEEHEHGFWCFLYCPGYEHTHGTGSCNTENCPHTEHTADCACGLTEHTHGDGTCACTHDCRAEGCYSNVLTCTNTDDHTHGESCYTTYYTWTLAATKATGTVTVKSGNSTVRNVTVTLSNGTTATTNRSGVATFENLIPGEYTASVKQIGDSWTYEGSATLTVTKDGGAATISLQNMGYTMDNAYARYDSVATFDHIDIRVAGSIAYKTYVNGTLTGTETKNVTVSDPSVIVYYANGEELGRKSWEGDNDEDYEWRWSGGRKNPVSIPKDAKVVLTCDITIDGVKREDQQFTFEGRDAFALAIYNCDGKSGLDFNVAAEDITQTFYHSVTYDWTGLPSGLATAPTDPADYVDQASVTVDTSFPAGYEVTAANGDVYTFSGWTTYTPEGGSATALNSAATFAITADTVVSGTWAHTPYVAPSGEDGSDSALTTSVTLTKTWSGDSADVRPTTEAFKNWLTLTPAAPAGATLAVTDNGNNTYTAVWSNLPLLDGNGAAVDYRVSETIPAGYANYTAGAVSQNSAAYTQGTITVGTPTTTCSDTTFQLSDSRNIDYIAINLRSNYGFVVWTSRAATAAEKTAIKNAIAAAESSFGQITGKTCNFISGAGAKYTQNATESVEIKAVDGGMLLDFTGTKVWSAWLSGQVPYTVTAVAASLTNTYTAPTTSFTVYKVWDHGTGDYANPEALRPASAEVEVKLQQSADGVTWTDVADSTKATVNGSATWTELPKYVSGTTEYQYRAVETSVIPNYTASGASAYNATSERYEITNTYQAATTDVNAASFNIVKEDSANSATKLPGAVFTLYSDAACTIAVGNPSQPTDAEGKTTVTIPATSLTGESVTLYLKETQQPSGYALPGTVYEVTVSKANAGEYNIEIVAPTTGNVFQNIYNWFVGVFNGGNDLLSGGTLIVKNTKVYSLSVTKAWSGVSGAPANFAASFQLQQKDGETWTDVGAAVAYSVFTSNSYTFQGLYAGTYRVLETIGNNGGSTAAGGYHYSGEPTVMSGEAALPGTASVTVTNTYAYNPVTTNNGQLTITKAIGAANQLEGADTRTYTFTVTGPNGFSTIVTLDGETDATETSAYSAVLTELAAGDYTVSENDANVAAYTLTTTTDKANNSNVVALSAVPVGNQGDTQVSSGSIAFTNTYTKKLGDDVHQASFNIVKEDSANSAMKLSGAVFTLYSDKACTVAVGNPSLPTDAEGKTTVTIPATSLTGESVTLYLKETVQPSGYALPGTVYEVTANKANNGAYNIQVVGPTAGNVFQNIYTWFVGVFNGGNDLLSGNTLIVPNTKLYSLSVTKAWSGISGVPAGFDASFQLQQKDGETWTNVGAAVAYSAFSNNSYTFQSLYAGTYRVVETIGNNGGSTAAGGYHYSGETTVMSDEATLPGTASVTVTNTYAYNPITNTNGTLTVTKQVSGAALPETFRITVKNSSGATVAVLGVKAAEGVQQPDANTGYQWTISNLPAGAYTAEESGAEIAHYTLSTTGSTLSATLAVSGSVNASGNYDVGSGTIALVNNYTEHAKYGVEYDYVAESGTLPAAISVSSGSYAISDNSKYYAGETAQNKGPQSPANYTVATGYWYLKSWTVENPVVAADKTTKFTGVWAFAQNGTGSVTVNYFLDDGNYDAAAHTGTPLASGRTDTDIIGLSFDMSSDKRDTLSGGFSYSRTVSNLADNAVAGKYSETHAFVDYLYTRDTGTLVVTKTFSGVNDLPENFTITVDGAERDYTLTTTDKTAVNNTYAWELTVLTGDYTLNESNAEMGNYILSKTGDGQRVTVVKNAAPAEAALSNTYTVPSYPTPDPTYYTLTVNWVDDAGAALDAATSSTRLAGDSYTTEQKSFTGYSFVRTEGDAVSGTMNGNKVVTYVYTQDAELPDEEPPLTELPDEEPPLAELPDEDVPLTELPETDVPLADAPRTGDSAVLWILLSILSGLGLAWVCIADKKNAKAKH